MRWACCTSRRRLVASGAEEATTLRQSETELRRALRGGGGGLARSLLKEKRARSLITTGSTSEAASHRTDDHDVELGRDSAPAAASGTWGRSVSVVEPGEGGNDSSERRDIARGGSVQRGEAEARGGWQGMRSTAARDSNEASAGRLR
jgi:hypothetical protein